MRRLALSFPVSRLALLAVAVLAMGLGFPTAGEARASSCVVPGGQALERSGAPLRFGIYPGGAAGSVNLKAAPRPEDPAKRLAGLQALAGSNPFVVRLYSGWTGGAGVEEVGSWLDAEIAGYTAAGLQVELVVRYKPAGVVAATAPSTFAAHVRGLVRRYGGDPGFVSLQVTNEANLPGAPEAADGAYAGVAGAVVKGVVAASDQARRDGGDQLKVGFSWAYDERPQAGRGFWKKLGQLGGRRFAAAVDWVGLDSYPGTWGPQLPLSRRAPALAAGAVAENVRVLRECFMPLAGLGGATSVHIAENGFPTGLGRSEQMQSRVLKAMVSAVDAIHLKYGISDYRWFDLRDSSSADASVESQYGITRDDYTPKLAFAAFRTMVDRYSS